MATMDLDGIIPFPICCFGGFIRDNLCFCSDPKILLRWLVMLNLRSCFKKEIIKRLPKILVEQCLRN